MQQRPAPDEHGVDRRPGQPGGGRRQLGRRLGPGKGCDVPARQGEFGGEQIELVGQILAPALSSALIGAGAGFGQLAGVVGVVQGEQATAGLLCPGQGVGSALAGDVAT